MLLAKFQFRRAEPYMHEISGRSDEVGKRRSCVKLTDQCNGSAHIQMEARCAIRKTLFFRSNPPSARHHLLLPSNRDRPPGRYRIPVWSTETPDPRLLYKARLLSLYGYSQKRQHGTTGILKAAIFRDHR